MKLLPHLLFLSAAGPAVLGATTGRQDALHRREADAQDRKSHSDKDFVSRARDATTDYSNNTGSIARQVFQSESPQNSQASTKVWRRSELDGRRIGRRSNHEIHSLTHSRRDSHALSDKALVRKEFRTDSNTFSAKLTRRGNCIGSMCGWGEKTKDIHKLDPPWGPSPASSPSQSFIHPSPFSMVPENRVGKKANELATGSSASFSGQSTTSQASSPVSPKPDLDLERSRGSDQLTAEFNKAYSVLIDKGSGYKPGLRKNLETGIQPNPDSETQKGDKGKGLARNHVEAPSSSTSTKSPKAKSSRVVATDDRHPMQEESKPSREDVGIQPSPSDRPIRSKALQMPDKQFESASKYAVADQRRVGVAGQTPREAAIAATLSRVHLGRYTPPYGARRKSVEKEAKNAAGKAPTEVEMSKKAPNRFGIPTGNRGASSAEQRSPGPIGGGITVPEGPNSRVDKKSGAQKSRPDKKQNGDSNNTGKAPKPARIQAPKTPPPAHKSKST